MNKKRLIITSLISITLVAVLLLSSTYSIFTSSDVDEDMNVYTTGNLNITYTLSNKNVQITDITPRTEEEADSVIPYRITVKNTGNVPYKFNLILNDTTTTNVIDYQYIMTKVGYLEAKPLSECNTNIIKEDIILPAGESVDIDIRIWLSDKLQNTEIGKSFYAKLSIDGLAIYDDSTDIDNSILSLRYINTSLALEFRNDDYREFIKNVFFIDYIDTSNASVDNNGKKIVWDMSENNDGSLVSWLEDNETEGYYDLYIGSNEKIYIKDFSNFFDDMPALENVHFDNLDTSNVTDMTYMFRDCTNLTHLDLSGFDTSNVTKIGGMFYGCKNLVSLDLSSFDTSKVTGMTLLFTGCSSLKSLDLSNIDTSHVTSMANMFNGCSSLTSLNISNFDTSNVTDMSNMFRDCNNLTTLDLNSFNTSNVTKMNFMFSGCKNLHTLNLSSFNTTKVTGMSNMFAGCTSLTSLDLSSFDTSNLTAMTNMFRTCKKINTTLNIKNNDIDNTIYNNIFNDAAIEPGSSIIINYTSATSSLVDNMIATKSNNSNVVKGELIY